MYLQIIKHTEQSSLNRYRVIRNAMALTLGYLSKFCVCIFFWNNFVCTHFADLSVYVINEKRYIDKSIDRWRERVREGKCT